MPAPDLAILDDLAARLEAATGADKRLNDRLHDALEQEASFAPDYTGSVDAALALVERLLPNCSWLVGSDGRAWLFSTPSFDLTTGVTGKGRTAPLAVCLALVRALRQETDHG